MVSKTPNTELIDYQFKTMNEKLEQHQDYTRGEFSSLHSKLDKFIETADKTFVKIIELEPIKAKQIEHDKIIERIAWWSIGTLVTIILGIAGITKYM